MSLWHRTVKVALATSLAFWLAEQLNLAYASSAGIIALLSVLETRRTSFRVARERLIATLLALLMASLLFRVAGFSHWSFLLFLLLYLPVGYHLKVATGLAPSTVLVLHILQEEVVTLELLRNEMALFGLGTSLALLVNLYMPSKTEAIKAYHQRVEEGLKLILLDFQDVLQTGNRHLSQLQLIKKVSEEVQEALDLVYRDQHNQLFHQTNYQVHYFDMRLAQLRLLERMGSLLDELHVPSRESILLAQLFSEVAQQLSEVNSGQDLLLDIDRFLTVFRQSDLPQTRIDFENRALLFQLLNDVHQFVQIKVDFVANYHEN